ncbi:MAG: hypothetical protein Q8P67_21525 [archaeon]|nr:hypothetical protein [archaeon]
MEQLTTLSRTIASLLGRLEHLIPAVFQGLITDAVDKCPTPELLFRGDAMAPRIMKEYLVNTSQPFFIRLLRRDVTKLLLSKKVMNNSQIIKPAQTVLDKICNPELVLPPSLLALCLIIARVVAAKFPGQERPALAGTIFLRFICPMLIQPQLFINGIPAANVKNVVHLARLLQALANSTVDQGTISQYEKFFTQANVQKMTAFLHSLSDRPPSTDQPLSAPPTSVQPTAFPALEETPPTSALPPGLRSSRDFIGEELPPAVDPPPDVGQLLSIFYSLAIRVRMAIKNSRLITSELTEQLLSEWDAICQQTRVAVSELSFSTPLISQRIVQTAFLPPDGFILSRSTSVPQGKWRNPMGAPPSIVLSPSLESSCSHPARGDPASYKFISVPQSSSLMTERDACIRAWTTDQVVEWLECNELRSLSEHFRERNVDGHALLSLKSASLIPGDLKLGVRKSFIRCHQHLSRSVLDPMDDSAFASPEEQIMALKEHLLRQASNVGTCPSPRFHP